MKINNLFHTLGVISCLLTIFTNLCNPNLKLVESYWVFVSLGWCLSSWINSYFANKKD
jgi:hypothetical protein